MENTAVLNAGRPLILIVDDAATNIQVLGNILDRENYEIAVSTDGVQALKMIDEISPDLILLDVMMPRMDGFEVCRKLKESSRTRDIPVIFLTARTETDDIVTGLRMGAVDYVTKPFSSYELLARVGTHVELKRCRDYIINSNRSLREEIETRERLMNENKRLMEELVRYNRMLENLAVRDSLTGLYNHKNIMERLEDEVNESARYGHPLSVIMFDLDHFKDINDRFGHLVGDEILVRVSSAISSRIRKVDIAGRYGGEEFLVILPHTALNGAFYMADSIRSMIGDITWSIDGLSVTISGGVAENSGNRAREFVDRADSLLYSAKKNGRNRIEYGK